MATARGWPETPMADVTETSTESAAETPDGPGLGLDLPEVQAPAAAKAGDGDYRVLARKYRPQTFSALIGQEALVRTLENAFRTNRIAHAFILTGVRGVGKTTTARIIAKGLNCTASDGPTTSPCGECENCRRIAESRHVDVLEMDAASRTGIDDIREIIDGVRYLPVSARYKVYIIDEVHMLSKAAFNGLLKTLEEPPPHAKFIFATTEIRKVPVTVLSRCQRFDLKRIEGEKIVEHLAGICAAEGVEVERPALSLIARAAEGSMRDALSLLDQAIAHGGGTADAALVGDMLGLADRAILFEMLEAAFGGRPADALSALDRLHAAGADPQTVIADLLDIVHGATRLKVAPALAEGAALPEAERQGLQAMAEKMALPVLTRAWQMLLKSAGEVARAPRPQSAAEMAVIRLAHAADLPPPGDLVKRLTEGGAVAQGGPAPRGPGGGGGGGARLAIAARSEPAAVAVPQAEAQVETTQPAVALASFDDVIALASEKRDVLLKTRLETMVRLVSFAPGRLEIQPTENAPQSLCGEIQQKLSAWTGMRWAVTVGRGQAEPTREEARRATANRRRAEAEAHPLVQAVMAAFPGATLADVRERDAAPAGAALLDEEAEGGADMPVDPGEDME